MKKTFVLPLAVVAALGLAACTEAEQDAAADETSEAAADVEATTDEMVADVDAAADEAMDEMDAMADDVEAEADDMVDGEEAPAAE